MINTDSKYATQSGNEISILQFIKIFLEELKGSNRYVLVTGEGKVFDDPFSIADFVADAPIVVDEDVSLLKSDDGTQKIRMPIDRKQKRIDEYG